MHSLFAIRKSSSPKQPYSPQINALSRRLDHQHQRLKAKIDKPTPSFGKQPMFDQPQMPPKDSLDFMWGAITVVSGLSISQGGLMKLRRGDPNNHFTLAVESDSREVVGDMARKRDCGFDKP